MFCRDVLLQQQNIAVACVAAQASPSPASPSPYKPHGRNPPFSNPHLGTIQPRTPPVRLHAAQGKTNRHKLCTPSRQSMVTCWEVTHRAPKPKGTREQHAPSYDKPDCARMYNAPPIQSRLHTLTKPPAPHTLIGFCYLSESDR